VYKGTLRGLHSVPKRSEKEILKEKIIPSSWGSSHIDQKRIYEGEILLKIQKE
jgi:hypothetical protein